MEAIDLLEILTGAGPLYLNFIRSDSEEKN